MLKVSYTAAQARYEVAQYRASIKERFEEDAQVKLNSIMKEIAEAAKEGRTSIYVDKYELNGINNRWPSVNESVWDMFEETLKQAGYQVEKEMMSGDMVIRFDQPQLEMGDADEISAHIAQALSPDLGPDEIEKTGQELDVSEIV